jgi:hypothetical protein
LIFLFDWKRTHSRQRRACICHPDLLGRPAEQQVPPLRALRSGRDDNKKTKADALRASPTSAKTGQIWGTRSFLRCLLSRLNILVEVEVSDGFVEGLLGDFLLLL